VPLPNAAEPVVGGTERCNITMTGGSGSRHGSTLRTMGRDGIGGSPPKTGSTPTPEDIAE